MTPGEALADLKDNCDHGVEPDCWYCKIASLIREQQSRLGTTESAYRHALEITEHAANEQIALQGRLEESEKWRGRAERTMEHNAAERDIAVQEVFELRSRLDAYEKRIDEQRTIIEAGQKSARPVLDELESLRSRLGSIEKFDEASGLCCVKGCTELSVWCCPPLCEHHTALLEPVVETSLPFDEDGLPEMKKLGTLVGKTKPIKPMEPPSE